MVKNHTVGSETHSCYHSSLALEPHNQLFSEYIIQSYSLTQYLFERYSAFIAMRESEDGISPYP